MHLLKFISPALGAALCIGCLCGASKSDGQAAVERLASVTWSANLKGSKEKPPVFTDAKGIAVFFFDFKAQILTIRVDVQNVSNVRAIELRASHTNRDLTGPEIFSIYDASAGPFSGSITKNVPRALFEKVANTVLNGQALVELSTTDHPRGEICGRVMMHKSYE
jgi:hypothetical protein